MNQGASPFTGSECHVLIAKTQLANQNASLPIVKERRSKNAEWDLQSVFKNAFRINSHFVDTLNSYFANCSNCPNPELFLCGIRRVGFLDESPLRESSHPTRP